MSDYISRKAAVKIAQKYGLANGSALRQRTGLADCIAIEIEGLPAADAEPVRHGQWLRTDDDWNSLVTIQCSACGGEWCFEVDEDVQLPGYNYCPGCGCKMDLEDETDDN